MMKGKNKIEKHTVEKKRKRQREKNAHVETDTSTLNIEVDTRMQARTKKKEKSSTNKNRKNKVKTLIARQRPKDEVDLEEKSDGVLDNYVDAQDVRDSKEHGDTDTRVAIKPCRSKKAKKKRKKEESFVKEVQNSPKNGGGPNQDEIYVISFGDEDCSKGMKKFIMDYNQSRPGLKVLQHQIDNFITTHEEKLEEKMQ